MTIQGPNGLRFEFYLMSFSHTLHEVHGQTYKHLSLLENLITLKFVILTYFAVQIPN